MKRLLLALTCALAFVSTAALAAVNVNTASADQLSQLDGIGDVKAQAIVKDRTANGPYKTLDDMTRVSGVGQKTVDGLREAATVGQAKRSSTGQ